MIRTLSTLAFISLLFAAGCGDPIVGSSGGGMPMGQGGAGGTVGQGSPTVMAITVSRAPGMQAIGAGGASTGSDTATGTPTTGSPQPVGATGTSTGTTRPAPGTISTGNVEPGATGPSVGAGPTPP